MVYLSSIGKYINHDSEQYVFAAYLMESLNIYQDFVYLHPPYFPVLLSSIFYFIDGEYFLYARLCVFVFSFATVFVVLAMTRRITGDLSIATAFAVIVSLSPIFLWASQQARNDMTACFFCVLAIWLIFEALSANKFGKVLFFLGGFCVAISVGTKITYAFVPVIVVVYVLIRAGGTLSENIRTATVPLVLGGGASSIPIIYFAVRAWDNFLFEVYQFHLAAPHDWYDRNGLREMLNRFKEAIVVKNFLFSDVLLICFVFIFFVMLVVLREKNFHTFVRDFNDKHGFLFVLLFVVGLPFCMIPLPSYEPYFLPMIPLIVLCTSVFYATSGAVLADTRGQLVLALTVVVALNGLPALARDAWRGVDGDRRMTTRVHRTATEIRNALESRGIVGKVATLSPIRVIDAGVPVYREFASGPFLFRSGNLYSPEKLHALHALSPETLDEFLDNDPPAAILTGFEQAGFGPRPGSKFTIAADAPLEAYAATRGYEEVKGDFEGKGRLFVRKR